MIICKKRIEEKLMGMNLRKNGSGYGGGKSVSKTNQRIIIYNNTMDIRFLELAR